MELAAAVLITLLVAGFILFVQEKDIPKLPPPPPYKYLEERKSVIYDGLRDLNFEYRLGKLSDSDYQTTKSELQRELATVLETIDAMKAKAPGTVAPVPPAKPAPTGTVCPHCDAKFPKPLKFCGECGKPMAKEVSA